MEAREHCNRKRRGKKVERESNQREGSSGASAEGVQHILTFLEHPIDREAEHHLLKRNNPGAKSPKLPTHLWLSRAALGRKQVLTVWNHMSTTKELMSC